MGRPSKTKVEFVKQARAVHGTVYDYSESVYVNARTKMTITCNKCGHAFDQTPHNHLKGRGCPECMRLARTKTKAQFISEAIEVHGTIYDYSESVYVNTGIKVTITCLTCGHVFKQTPSDHIRGHGCPNCNLAKTKTTAQFIREAIKIHGTVYDYSKSVYVNARTKMTITCNKCGHVFEQNPNHHLQGCGCPNCSRLAQTKTKAQFISEAIEVHGTIYDYSESIYVNNSTKVTITCNKCGHVFEQAPNSHLNGQGCPNCNLAKTKTKAQFIRDAIKVHGTVYCYSKSVYVNARTKMTITCNKCGHVFEQNPNNHLNGQGCPRCNNSTGEQYINKWLIDHNIKPKLQYRIEKCRNQRPLPFDFAIKINNQLGLIEYQGLHHYEPVLYSKSKEKNWIKYVRTVKHDSIKMQYCIHNKIPILIIPYYWTKEQIDEALSQFVKQLKSITNYVKKRLWSVLHD